MKPPTRIEADSLGTIEVPADRLWGAQTQRSLEQFKIGEFRFPPEFIHAYALVKQAAAIANERLGLLAPDKARAVILAAEEVRAGKWDAHFPLVIFQTGSGTQTNMNLNEVIARRAQELREVAAPTDAGAIHPPIHPNDDVNRSQSSNDSFPTAMHIAIVGEIHRRLIPAVQKLQATLDAKARANHSVIKLGRTHLQDAVPLTLGNEISGWAMQLEKGLERVRSALPELMELALGGSAVGTGLNTHPDFAVSAIGEISRLSGDSFCPARNRFEALAAHDAVAQLSGTLRTLAGALLKVVNDIRWLASGPRAGIGELSIPVNEPGSSIMPAKANPTQAEAMSMVVAQVYGYDAAVAFAASQGSFELNTYKPLMVYNVLLSIRLLSDACDSFDRHCAQGLEPRLEQIKKHVESSLMLATALNPHLGYEKVAQIVKKADTENLTLKAATVALGYASAKDFDHWMDLTQMLGPHAVT